MAEDDEAEEADEEEGVEEGEEAGEEEVAHNRKKSKQNLSGLSSFPKHIKYYEVVLVKL